MKSITIQTKLGLLATIACVGLATPAHAVVTWIVSEDASGVTISTDGGSLNLGSTTAAFTNLGGVNAASVASDSLWSQPNLRHRAAANTGTATPLVGASAFAFDVASGHAFGHTDDYVSWDPTWGTTPGVITPISTIDFAAGTTINSIFSNSLNGGPVTVWTHDTTGDTIQVKLAIPAPEPSSTALLGLGGLALMIRRRR